MSKQKEFFLWYVGFHCITFAIPHQYVCTREKNAYVNARITIPSERTWGKIGKAISKSLHRI
jgi:hypothetical protein